jgi:hypothetical protein
LCCRATLTELNTKPISFHPPVNTGGYYRATLTEFFLTTLPYQNYIHELAANVLVYREYSHAKFFMQLGRFDELGSGILNINRYLKAYSGHNHPQFIEGAVFKIIIPLDESLTDTLNDKDAIDDAVKLRLSGELIYVFRNGKIRLPEITTQFGIKRAQAQRDMTILKKNNKIDLENLPEPDTLIDEIIENVQSALDSFKTIKDYMK